MNGTTAVASDDRLRTVLTLGDRAATVEITRRTAHRLVEARRHVHGRRHLHGERPRDQRHAVATTRERYRLHGSAGCYDRSLTTVQGVLTEDHTRC